MNVPSRIMDDLLELIFPSLCITCGERLLSQERHICLECWQDLPVNDFHLNPENRVAQLFWGRIRMEQAASFFHYRKGSRYQKLIHAIKYKGLKELGHETGQRYGAVLAESGPFRAVDVLVPVPLHPRKQKKRGYNQSEWIARGLGKSMHKPVVADNLFRRVHTSSQTRKSRFERWQNVEGIFGIRRPEDFSGKHVLLVDDVVTTGATVEACASQVLKTGNAKVSMASLAFAEI